MSDIGGLVSIIFYMLNSFVEPISIKLFKIAAIEKLSMAHTRRKSFFDLQNISSKIKTK